MHSSVFHAPLQPPPRSRHSAREERQRPSNGPKRSKQPARHPALSSAWFRRLSTPSERVSCPRCLACITYPGADHQAYVLRTSSTVNNVRYPLWNEPVSLPSNPGTRYSCVHLDLGRCTACRLSFGCQRSEWPANYPSLQDHKLHSHHMEKTPPRPSHPPRALFKLDTG